MYKILIADDEPQIREILRVYFEKEGFQVVEAADGKEALQQITKERPDILLLDVMMPVMDGLAATRKIRSEPRWAKLPIVMLTAKAMPDDQERCIDAGANDYMAKPIDVDKLLSLVRVWMPR